MTATTPNSPTTPEAAEAAAAADARPEGDVAARLAALEAENADLKDRLLRTIAEGENLRRRTEREVKDAKTYAISAFARDCLTVADNLRRALDAVDPETRKSASAGLKTLLDGVELTEREFLKVLERSGIRRIEPKGERFDPNLHQAMFEVPDPSVPAGTVVQVVQAGFVIGDRVLRPAMVGVAKGGPKPAREGGETAETGIDRTV